MTEKILSSLGLKMTPRDLKYTEPRTPVQSLMSSWLPLGRNLLDMCVQILPSPLEITEAKVEHLIASNMSKFRAMPHQTQQLKKGKELHTHSNNGDAVEKKRRSKVDSPIS